VADPLFNIVFRWPDGRLATARELSHDPALVAAGRRSAEERFDIWEDRLYTYQQVRRFPWFAIPVVGESLRGLLVSVIPAATVDAWATPGWLERPQLTIAMVSWGLAGLLGATLLLGRRAPAGQAAPRPAPVPLPAAGRAPTLVARRKSDDTEDPRLSA
jgi:hypothetical protein